MLRVAVIVLALLGSSEPARAALQTEHPPVAAAAEGHGGGHGEAASPLNFQSDLALWTAIVFLVLLAVLWRFAWGPIAKGLEGREQMIADQIAQAERSNAEARQLLADYQQKLAGSQDEVRAILEQARRDAEQRGRELIELSRTEAKREQEKSLREIEQAKDGALKELAQMSARLAVDLAGKIVGSRLEPADHARLIEQAIADFPKDKSQYN
jgi:F-type H+-transporting ATPase subunit b